MTMSTWLGAFDRRLVMAAAALGAGLLAGPTTSDGTELLAGSWSGQATVEAQVFLQGGVFPVTVALSQSGNQVRGILDLHQDAGMFAESFGYLFDGVVTGNELQLELTDRMCGAGDPVGLCYPNWTVERVFSARGQLLGDRMVWDSVVVLDGVNYPPGVAIEIPFVELEIEIAAQPYSGAPQRSPIEDEWAGPCYIPQSVIYPLPLPLYGANDMTVAAVANEPTIVHFDNQGFNIVPTFNDIILADSFAYDEATGFFWFVQLATESYRWLYVGRRYGSMLTGLVLFDSYADPYFNDTSPPIDQMATDLPDVAGVFHFFSVLFRDGFESGDTSAWSPGHSPGAQHTRHSFRIVSPRPPPS